MLIKISSKIELRWTECTGKGFYAKQNIEQGEELMNIDDEIFISLNRFLSFAQILHIDSNLISNISLFSFCLCAVNVIQRSHLQQQHKDIHQYVRDLPHTMQGLINWSNQQMDLLNNKQLINSVKQKQSRIKDEFQLIMETVKNFWKTSKILKLQYRLFSCYQQINKITVQEFIYFYSVIESRSVHYACSQGVGALAPKLELFNHSQNPQCRVQGDQKYKVRTVRKINANQQIFVSYGRNNIHTFLQLYGFLPNLQKPLPQNQNYRSQVASWYNKYYRENSHVGQQQNKQPI